MKRFGSPLIILHMFPVSTAQIDLLQRTQLSALGLLVAVDKVFVPGDKAEANLTAGQRSARRCSRRHGHAGCLICAGESRIRAWTSKGNRQLNNKPEDLLEKCNYSTNGEHICLSADFRRKERSVRRMLGIKGYLW